MRHHGPLDSADWPLVSVLTIHRGPASALRALAGQLALQTYPLDRLQWVVVDDHSPEPPPVELADNQTPFETVLIRPSEHLGRARARNLTLKHAGGSIVIFIDSDMLPAPTWAEVLVRDVLRSDAVVIGRHDPGPGSRRGAYTRYAHSRGVHKLPAGARVPGKYFITNNSALPADLVARVGGFDEGFRHWGGEDLEFGLRLERAGVALYHDPRARSWHDFQVDWPRQEWRYLVYGGTGVMRILQRHPNAERLLSLDKLRFRPELGMWRGRIRPALLRLACHSLVYRILRWKLLTWPRFPWPDQLFDYMIFYLYSRAFHKRLKGEWHG